MSVFFSKLNIVLHIKVAPQLQQTIKTIKQHAATKNITYKDVDPASY